MIDEQIKVHDKFSLEMKVGFYAHTNESTKASSMNIWMFVPNSLDVNRFTYEKKDFYRDMKSNIRLITPICPLLEVAEGEASPFGILQKSIERMVREPHQLHREEYEYHIKMFMSMLKSSLREEVNAIKQSSSDLVLLKIKEYIRLVEKISARYRSFFTIIDIPRIESQLIEYFRFGDEFMCNLVNFQSFTLMKVFKKNSDFEQIKSLLSATVSKEIAYKNHMGYLIVEKDEKHLNSELVNRLSLLKKYVESQLFINVTKQKDGMLVEQLLFSFAAGISMIFATAVAFSVQQTYGNFTMPFFVALVISYMLKDRIKDFTRYYFAHKMGSRYFDHKTNMSIHQQEIGWVKENMDFVSEDNIPLEIVKARNCTSIIEANNRANSEKVMLYRMVMHIDKDKLNMQGKFLTEGVNAILRFNFLEFIRNMDNSEFPLYMLHDENGYELVNGRRLYYVNFVMQRTSGNQSVTNRYRIALNPNGIHKIEKFDVI